MMDRLKSHLLLLQKNITIPGIGEEKEKKRRQSFMDISKVLFSSCQCLLPFD